jgi:hypothetical protein
MNFAAPFGYTLGFETVTRVRTPPRLLEAEAVGELEGRGSWRLEPLERGTRVRYYWAVKTNKAWMNWLAPIARPVFDWNHDRIMSAGGRSIAARLGVELLRCENLSGPAAVDTWVAATA